MANRTVTNLTAVLQMNNTKFKKGLTGSQKALKGFQKQVTAIGGTLIAAFSVRAITNFTKASFQALDTQRKAEQSLLVALNGRIGAQQTLVNQAKELQKITLYGDEETIRAQALIGTMVKEEETIKRLMPLVQDFATAKNMQLSAAADLVAKSIGSSTNALSRYGITITGAVGSSERLETTVNALSKAFGGQAEAAAGADLMLTQIKNSWGDLQESFADWMASGSGGFISRGLKGGIDDLNKLFTPNNAEAMNKLTAFMNTLSDDSPEKQQAALTKEIERQRKVLEGLAKDRKKWQSDLDERGVFRGGRVAKMEIDQIDEKQDALLSVLRVFESQEAAIKKIDNAGGEEVKTQKEIFDAWTKINDQVKERIKLQDSLNTSILESQQAAVAGILKKADDDKKDKPQLWGSLYDNDEEWTGGDEAWEAISEHMKDVELSADKLGNQIGMSLVSQFDTLGEAVGKFASGAEDSFQGLGDAIMQNLGNILIMMGAQTGNIPLLLAGAGLQLGGGFLRGLGSSVNTSASGNRYDGGNVNFRISGNDLVGVMSRQNYRNNMVT